MDLVENRYVGLKSRGVYETPGGTILRARPPGGGIPHPGPGSDAPEGFPQPPVRRTGLLRLLVRPGAGALQKLIDEAQQPVTGTARLKLYKGNVTVVGRKAPKSLYQPDLVTFEAGGDYRQADATGFIRLNALRLKIRAGWKGNEVKSSKFKVLVNQKFLRYY